MTAVSFILYIFKENTLLQLTSSPDCLAGTFPSTDLTTGISICQTGILGMC